MEEWNCRFRICPWSHPLYSRLSSSDRSKLQVRPPALCTAWTMLTHSIQASQARRVARVSLCDRGIAMRRRHGSLRQRVSKVFRNARGFLCKIRRACRRPGSLEAAISGLWLRRGHRRSVQDAMWTLGARWTPSAHRRLGTAQFSQQFGGNGYAALSKGSRAIRGRNHGLPNAATEGYTESEISRILAVVSSSLCSAALRFVSGKTVPQ